MLCTLAAHFLYPIASLAIDTGMRRGELCGLQWGDVDLDGAALQVERAVEEIRQGLRVKGPKSKRGRRSNCITETNRQHASSTPRGATGEEAPSRPGKNNGDSARVL